MSEREAELLDRLWMLSAFSQAVRSKAKDEAFKELFAANLADLNTPVPPSLIVKRCLSLLFDVVVETSSTTSERKVFIPALTGLAIQWESEQISSSQYAFLFQQFFKSLVEYAPESRATIDDDSIAYFASEWGDLISRINTPHIAQSLESIPHAMPKPSHRRLSSQPAVVASSPDSSSDDDGGRARSRSRSVATGVNLKLQQQMNNAQLIDDIGKVQESWKNVVPIASTATTMFYDRLFEQYPGVRPLFKNSISAQAQHLADILNTVITNLTNVGGILEAVRALAIRHVSYGAQPAHYSAVGECLLWVLQSAFGDAFTEDLKVAWARVYGLISNSMILAMREHAERKRPSMASLMSKMVSCDRRIVTFQRVQATRTYRESISSRVDDMKATKAKSSQLHFYYSEKALSVDLWWSADNSVDANFVELVQDCLDLGGVSICVMSNERVHSLGKFPGSWKLERSLEHFIVKNLFQWSNGNSEGIKDSIEFDVEWIPDTATIDLDMQEGASSTSSVDGSTDIESDENAKWISRVSYQGIVREGLEFPVSWERGRSYRCVCSLLRHNGRIIGLLYGYITSPDIELQDMAKTLAKFSIQATTNVMSRINIQVLEEKEKAQGNLISKMSIPQTVLDKLIDSFAVNSSACYGVGEVFEEATVIFMDVKDFTGWARNRDAREIVYYMGLLFEAIEIAAEKYDVRPIKTLGDGYLLVSGVPEPSAAHATTMIRFVMYWQSVLDQVNKDMGIAFHMRYGVHTGPVVAGVIGVQNFSYDLWGETVNVASRLQSEAEPRTIVMSGTTAAKVAKSFDLKEHGQRKLKGVGSMDVFSMNL